LHWGAYDNDVCNIGANAGWQLKLVAKDSKNPIFFFFDERHWWTTPYIGAMPKKEHISTHQKSIVSVDLLPIIIIFIAIKYRKWKEEWERASGCEKAV